MQKSTARRPDAADASADAAGAGGPAAGPEPDRRRAARRARRGLAYLLRRMVLVTPAERRMLLPAFAVVAVMRVAIWVTPAPWLLRKVLARAANPRGRPSGDPAQVGIAVRRAARAIPRATCLPQALATLWLLARRGYGGELRIGVRKGRAGELMAHAWVELDGKIVVGDIGVKQFTVLPSLEGALWLR